MSNILDLARDKGRIAEKQLLFNPPLFEGAAYNLISSNDLCAVRRYILRLEETNDMLMKMADKYGE